MVSQPETGRFDFEYLPIVPERVLTGPLLEHTVAGLYVGWLHNVAALVTRLPIGKGDLIITTFHLLPHIGSDPIATCSCRIFLTWPPPATRQE